MRVIYINLDRRPERRAHMEQQLSQAGITNVKRIPAVDGATLDLHSPFLQSLFTATVLKEAREDKVFFVPGSRMTRGGIGCALSHRNVYQHLHDLGGEESVLVLEDDVHFSDHFVEKAQLVIASAPLDYDALYLGYHESWGNTPVSGNPVWMRPTRQVFGTFALYIRTSSAHRLLNALFPLTAQLDSAYSRQFNNLHLYLLPPRDCLVWPVTTMESDIQHSHHPSSSKSSLVMILFVVIMVLLIVIIFIMTL